MALANTGEVFDDKIFATGGYRYFGIVPQYEVSVFMVGINKMVVDEVGLMRAHKIGRRSHYGSK
jgi:hypothetical protein